MANHLKPIYVTAHLEGILFKRVLIDGGAAVNVLPYKQMKRVCRSEEDLIPTDLTVSSFSGAITRTHGILPLEVDLGSKQIMLAFFVVDNTSTYGALLGQRLDSSESLGAFYPTSTSSSLPFGRSYVTKFLGNGIG